MGKTTPTTNIPPSTSAKGLGSGLAKPVDPFTITPAPTPSSILENLNAGGVPSASTKAKEEPAPAEIVFPPSSVALALPKQDAKQAVKLISFEEKQKDFVSRYERGSNIPPTLSGFVMRANQEKETSEIGFAIPKELVATLTSFNKDGQRILVPGAISLATTKPDDWSVKKVVLGQNPLSGDGSIVGAITLHKRRGLGYYLSMPSYAVKVSGSDGTEDVKGYFALSTGKDGAIIPKLGVCYSGSNQLTVDVSVEFHLTGNSNGLQFANTPAIETPRLTQILATASPPLFASEKLPSTGNSSNENPLPSAGKPIATDKSLLMAALRNSLNLPISPNNRALVLDKIKLLAAASNSGATTSIKTPSSSNTDDTARRRQLSYQRRRP
jgi:hypothetical protein